VDTVNDALMHQSSYYYLGHFTRFIKPGAQRVLCAASRKELESTAFVNPDGSVAVVVMNRTEQAIAFAMCMGTETVATELPPRSIATYLTNAI
jgi:glucosylceramidase